MNKATAAVFHGEPKTIELRQFSVPKPRRREILVRILGCTVCGSDLHTFHGRRSVPAPTVLGHEMVGEIVTMGAPVKRHDIAGDELRIGDRVTWAIVAACGACDMCQRDLPQKCHSGIKYGHERFSKGRELLGGLASHCLLVPGTAIVRLPDDLPIEVGCPANCATATVAAALEAAGDLRGSSVCIFGAGMLGLTACAMACSQGAREVVCVEPVDQRRELAKKFGATRLVSPQELLAQVQTAVGGLGFDVLLEMSGSSLAFHPACPYVRTGGTIVLVGSVSPSSPVPVLLDQIVRRHLTIRGIHNYGPRHLLTAVQFLSENHQRFPFAKLVGQWYPLDLVADAFAESAKYIRVGVKPF